MSNRPKKITWKELLYNNVVDENDVQFFTKIAFESNDNYIDYLEKENKLLKETLEFYAKPSTWGIDKPGNKTSVDPVDHDYIDNPKFEDIRGGKKARNVLKLLGHIVG
jgi:hypothetical protein